jgi:O-antigen/teichoic acid export membrane protein
MTRTKNSIKNITVALAGQSVGIVVSFIARIFFIRVLGTEYLGISGLFTNILTMLSLVELGIGPAIIFSLYKPLAEDDKPKVQALMRLYKNAYTIIGILVAALGLSITPFLHVLIKEMPNVPDLNLIFILFVINSAISYFYAYKRNLIIADQHRYIATIYRYCLFAADHIPVSDKELYSILNSSDCLHAGREHNGFNTCRPNVSLFEGENA